MKEHATNEKDDQVKGQTKGEVQSKEVMLKGQRLKHMSNVIRNIFKLKADLDQDISQAGEKDLFMDKERFDSQNTDKVYKADNGIDNFNRKGHNDNRKKTKDQVTDLKADKLQNKVNKSNQVHEIECENDESKNQRETNDETKKAEYKWYDLRLFPEPEESCPMIEEKVEKAVSYLENIIQKNESPFWQSSV